MLGLSSFFLFLMFHFPFLPFFLHIFPVPFLPFSSSFLFPLSSYFLIFSLLFFPQPTIHIHLQSFIFLLINKKIQVYFSYFLGLNSYHQLIFQIKKTRFCFSYLSFVKRLTL